jgi:hypothetical protein
MSFQHNRGSTTINSWNRDGRGGRGDRDDDDDDRRRGGSSWDRDHDWNRRDNNDRKDWDWNRRDNDNDWWKKIFPKSKTSIYRRKYTGTHYNNRRRYINTNGHIKKWWDQFIFPYFNIPWPAPSPIIPTLTGYPYPSPYPYSPYPTVPNYITPGAGYTPPLPVPISYKTTPGYPYNTVTPQYSSPYYY